MADNSTKVQAKILARLAGGAKLVRCTEGLRGFVRSYRTDVRPRATIGGDFVDELVAAGYIEEDQGDVFVISDAGRDILDEWVEGATVVLDVAETVRAEGRSPNSVDVLSAAIANGFYVDGMPARSAVKRAQDVLTVVSSAQGGAVELVSDHQ